MLPIQNITMVKPHEAEPGTLLIASSHYTREPVLMCKSEKNNQMMLTLSQEEERPFLLREAVVNIGYWLDAGQPTFSVDYRKLISPTRSDIPVGALVIANGKPSIVARLNYYTVNVGLDGAIVEEPGYDNFVAFASWRITVPGVDDKQVKIFEADLTEFIK